MNFVRIKGKMVVGLFVLASGGVGYSQAQPNNASTQPQVQGVNIQGKSELPEDTVANGQGKKLDEVVVTAMGIKSNAKSLGYSASTIKAEDVTQAASSSAMSGLVGKVAGVNISTAGGAGTSQKVIIRGISSFSNNQPLYVVDGVPMLNSFMGTNTTGNSVDFGNQANDINPDDIESMTVLKGASATALYGSRASSGVIMITTKRGQQNQKLSVTYNGSFMAVNVLKLPLTQNRFGQGWPYWDPGENGSWGPKLDGRINQWGAWSPTGTVPSATPPNNYQVLEKPFSYINNNARNFYQTGFETNNNISVSGGNSLASFLMSYGNAYTNGVIPTNIDRYIRNTFSFRGDLKYKKFGASFDVNYINNNVSAVAAGQGNNGSTTFQDLIQVPVDIPISSFKNYTTSQNPDNFYTWYASNPFWIIHNSGNTYKSDRVFGKIELSYEIVKGLKAVGRLSGDYTNAIIEYYNNKVNYTPGSWSSLDDLKNPEYGYYQHRTDKLSQTEVTAFLDANYELWKKNISLHALAGYNYNDNKIGYYSNYISSLVIPNYYQITNSGSLPIPEISQLNRRLMAGFGQIDLGFRDYWFLNLSLRNDWSSTLPINANSYFYWGLNTSLVITDMLHREFGIGMKGVDFLKLRAAYGTTGKDASTYRTNLSYPISNINLGFGSIIAPINGIPLWTINNNAPNTQLQPEFTTEYELGLEGKFLQNRLGFDFAWYDKTTKNQIISSNVAPESGFITYSRNIGKINNKGIELAIYGSPIKTKDWEWQLGLTFTKNWNKVLELWSDFGVPVKELIITTAYQTEYVAIVGKPLGIFRGPATETSPEGKTVVSNTTGRPIIDPTKRDEIGNSNPDFLLGLTTKLTWKGLSLSATFDYRQGGYFYSYTANLMYFVGNAMGSIYNDRHPFIVPNSVVKSGNPTTGYTYEENYRPVTAANSYYNHSTNTLIDGRPSVLDRTYLKLRELVVSYRLPSKLFGKSGIKGIEVSLIGRNLFVVTPNSNTFVDPEATNYGNDITSEFGEFAAAPSTRSYGASVKITF